MLLLLLSELQEVLQCRVDPPLGFLHLPDVDLQLHGGLGAGAGGDAGDRQVPRDVIVGHRGPLLVIRLRPALDKEHVVVAGLDY